MHVGVPESTTIPQKVSKTYVNMYPCVFKVSLNPFGTYCKICVSILEIVLTILSYLLISTKQETSYFKYTISTRPTLFRPIKSVLPSWLCALAWCFFLVDTAPYWFITLNLMVDITGVEHLISHRLWWNTVEVDSLSLYIHLFGFCLVPTFDPRLLFWYLNAPLTVRISLTRGRTK